MDCCPPTQWFEPTLTTDGSSGFGASTATSGSPASAAAATISASIAVVTARIPRCPFAATERTNAASKRSDSSAEPLGARTPVVTSTRSLCAPPTTPSRTRSE
ncbi:hypothetical protein C1I64_13180 [Rathayibacter festucae DSM 15932]|uniref:Uncharacterized protein n=1 Tax=Rathayibacter festucae DSM 15932 TaxID=1328866 RepID=A0A3T0T2P2_9MICO|nr:hypothetical protein C1I64_13180 [Rathayibacter festucae DSM 15932]